VTYKTVFRVVKSRSLFGWVGHVQLGRVEMKHSFYLGGGGRLGGGGGGGLCSV
jgi:hypothetical protein